MTEIKEAVLVQDEAANFDPDIESSEDDPLNPPKYVNKAQRTRARTVLDKLDFS